MALILQKWIRIKYVLNIDMYKEPSEIFVTGATD